MILPDHVRPTGVLMRSWTIICHECCKEITVMQRDSTYTMTKPIAELSLRKFEGYKKVKGFWTCGPCRRDEIS